MYSLDISGGTNVIFRHIKFLAQLNEITIINTSDHYSDASWFEDDFLSTNKINYYFLSDYHGETFDVCISTFWPTVYDSPKIDAAHRVYFVQSIEHRFLMGADPNVDHINLAYSTYSDFEGTFITATNWMQSYLWLHHQKFSFLCKNGIDRDVFHPKVYESRKQGSELRILVEGTYSNSLKNIQRSIEIASSTPKAVVTYVSPQKIQKPSGVDVFHQSLTQFQMSRVYCENDVLLKLSLVEGMFGPPLEMFACGGTAITYAVTGSDEYLMNGVNSFVCDFKDENQVIEALFKISHDKSLLARLQSNAFKTASAWPDWNTSSLNFSNILWQITSLNKKS
jgi:glycosyltransferase involved in cell wall biosynthesis